MTDQDVMIVFDTKGDFYQSFYRPGDVVISNDATACGPEGPDYWNLFNELEPGEDMEVAINEISKTLFAQRLKNTTQPFFPNAAKDLFGAVLAHFSRNQAASTVTTGPCASSWTPCPPPSCGRCWSSIRTCGP